MSFPDGATAILREQSSREGQGNRGETLALDETARSLTLLAEGAALAIPTIEARAYGEFRANVSRLSTQLSDRLPEDEKVALVRSIVQEFSQYRRAAEDELRNRSDAWQAVTELLLRDLLKSLGISEGASSASDLLKRIAGTSASRDLERLHEALERFLHPAGADSAPAEASQFHKVNHTTENDNAAGLRGGGSAIARLQGILEQGERGFLVLFRLSCLNMIHQRFGDEAVEDCLMAVSAFLMQNLHRDDTIYHWSDSSLLAIMQGRVNEQILTAELERIVLRNRETSVNIGGRTTMLRIPITYDITPIEHLETAEDLMKINLLSRTGSTR